MRKLLIILSILRVAFVGDPQVDNCVELDYARKSVYTELRNRNDLDLVIVLGDLVNENTELIVPSEESLDSLPCPWARVNGNHDGPVAVNDTTFTMSGVRFILMDNIRRNKKDYHGGLSDEQKKWLSTLAESSPGNEKWVLCTHIPLSECKDRDSIANILSSRPDLLLVSGHTHNVDRHIIERGIEEVIAGASCGSWWRGVKDSEGIPYALMNCGAPRGYFTADFSTGRIWYSLDYKVIGKPKEKKAEANVKDGKLTVNVYGGSREGKVEVLNGGRWVELKHTYTIAPNVERIIDSNNSADRKYRKEHKEEFIPMRRLSSPHLWVAEGIPARDEIIIRYSDRNMRFRQKLRTE